MTISRRRKRQWHTIQDQINHHQAILMARLRPWERSQGTHPRHPRPMGILNPLLLRLSSKRGNLGNKRRETIARFCWRCSLSLSWRSKCFSCPRLPLSRKRRIAWAGGPSCSCSWSEEGGATGVLAYFWGRVARLTPGIENLSAGRVVPQPLSPGLVGALAVGVPFLFL